MTSETSIEDIRKTRGWSKAELAERVGVDEAKITEIEEGKLDSSSFDLSLILDLIKALSGPEDVDMDSDEWGPNTYGRAGWWVYPAEEGHTVNCTVCDEQVQRFYSPKVATMTDEQKNIMEEIWGIETSVRQESCEFYVCESCLMGHCGAVEDHPTDDWWAKKYEEYKKEESSS